MSPSLNALVSEGDHYAVDPETGCWNWLRAKTKRGYALCSGPLRRDRHYLAHRAVYMAAGHELAKGIHLHHECKNVGCVNPDHMRALVPKLHYLHHKLEEKTGLTLDDIREIRRLGRIVGVTAQEVADRYGIHEITVYNYWGVHEVWNDVLGDEPMEKPMRECVRCGTSFNHRNRHAVYCSKHCQATAWNERRRAA